MSDEECKKSHKENEKGGVGVRTYNRNGDFTTKCTLTTV